jgi:ribonucleoside-diphosphate reductase alpha chain
MNKDIEKLLRDRYFLQTENTWDDVCERLKSLYPPMCEYLKDMKFIYSSPTLMNYCNNNERAGTLSSCFPMYLEDSIEGIFDAIKEAALVTKAGGGVGYDFSVLRGSKENIKTLNANSSGPVTFIEGFNGVLDMIRQGGKRRGAGAALLDITHPDIIEFINVKKDKNKLNRVNLSVKIPNVFYEKLKISPDAAHTVRNVMNNDEYELKNEEGEIITVKQLWNMLIDRAWESAEPGIFNSDIAFNQCTVTNVDKHVLINPCFEFVNIPYTACSLGSINLSKLVEGKKFDWEKFEDVIVHAVRALNTTIDKNKFPLKKIKEMTLKTRPIGLGYMGLAHALFKKEMPYNSERAIKFVEEMTRYLTLRAMRESVDLAKVFKASYEAFDYDLFMKANERFFKYKHCRNIDIEQLQKDIKKYGIRNSAFTAVAPTGTLSFISECSSGIEPVFALAYHRRIEVGNKEYETVYVADPVFEEYLSTNYTEEIKNNILKEVSENSGSCQKCKDIPKEMREIFVVANDLTPMEHLDILEVGCRNISMSVSKTVNVPEDIKKEELSTIFLAAHGKGIVGLTVYRQGSREGILLAGNTKVEDAIVERDAPKRPKSLPCHVYKITVKGDQWVVFVGLYKEHPYEVFAGKVNLVDIPSTIAEGVLTKVKSGTYVFEYNGEILIKDIAKIFESAEQEALTRMISTNLRHGTPVEFIIDQLSKSYGTIVDFNKAILRALKTYMKEKKLNKQCPSCGQTLMYKEGCIACIHCGWSKCA